jgi:hypothetical protein
MDLRSWTWMHLALMIAGYWLLVVAAWWFYTTRPAQQARARDRATTQILPGSRPGEQGITLSGTINLAGALAMLMGPPILLVVAWLAR